MPTAERCARADHDAAGDDDQCQNLGSGCRMIASDEPHPDDAVRLLRVVTDAPRAVERGARGGRQRNNLCPYASANPVPRGRTQSDRATAARQAAPWRSVFIYHFAMDQEVDQLGERIDRMLQVVRRLADENANLRDQLAASRGVNQQLQQRIAEARARVESALARLPLPAESGE